MKKKKLKTVIKKEGKIEKAIPIPKELASLIKERERSFKEYYGRKPSKDYLCCFEPIYGNEPLLQTVYSLRRAGIQEDYIYAFYKSDGLMPADTNKKLIPQKDIQEFNRLRDEFDGLMSKPPEGDPICALRFVLLSNPIIKETSEYVIRAVIDTLHDYLRRHSKNITILDYQMETELDYCLFSAIKTIKTLQSIQQLTTEHLTECMYALGRGIFENYLYLCNINRDSSFFADKLLPRVDQENYSFARRSDGSINYKRVIKNETGEERNVDVRIASLADNLPYETDRELYHAFYLTACQYVHVDVMSAQSYYSAFDPYDELDPALLASLIVGLLSVFLILQIGENASTKDQYKKDVMHLCCNVLFPKIQKCLLLANSDPEHKNDLFDLLLRRISENTSDDKNL